MLSVVQHSLTFIAASGMVTVAKGCWVAVLLVMGPTTLFAQPIELTLALKPDTEEKDSLDITLEYFIDEIQKGHSLEGVLELKSVTMPRSEVLWDVNEGRLDFGIVDTQTVERNQHDLGLPLQPIAIFNHPFLFSDVSDLAVTEESWLGAAVLDQLARSQTLLGLAFWNGGMTQFVGTTPFVDTRDFSNQVVLTSEFGADVLDAVGSTPAIVPLRDVEIVQSELRSAAAEVPELSIGAHMAARGYVTQLNYRPVVYVFVANRQKWHSLPEHAQQALAQAARNAGRRSTDIAIAGADTVRDKFSANYRTPSEETLSALRKASHDSWMKRPEELRTYWEDVQRVLAEERTMRTDPKRSSVGNADGRDKRLRVVFGTDRNDERTTFPKVSPESRMGSKRDAGNRYCGVVPITMSVDRPIADERKKYFVLDEFNLVPWVSDSQSCLELFDNELAGARESSIMLFVHGYNNSFADAARRAASLIVDTGFSGIVMIWSWPASGATLDYQFDEESTDFTRWNFHELVSTLMELDRLQRLLVITHSMGNRIVLDVLETMSHQEQELLLDQLIFAAPDVAVDVFRQKFGMAKDLARRRTLYANSNDCALRISERLHRQSRAGLGGTDLIVEGDMESIDATRLFWATPCPWGSWSQRHAYVFNNKVAVSDLEALIIRDESPLGRGLLRREKDGYPFWLLDD